MNKTAQQLTAEIMAPYIKRWEGTRQLPYRDTRGNWTVGTGINLQTPLAKAWLNSLGTTYEDVISRKRHLTPEELNAAYQQQVGGAVQSAYKLHPKLDTHPLPVRGIVADMIYNLGEGGYSNFNKARKALDARDYRGFAQQIKNTPWFKQTGQRAQHHYNTLEALRRGRPLPKVQPVLPAPVVPPTPVPVDVPAVSQNPTPAPTIKTGSTLSAKEILKNVLRKATHDDLQLFVPRGQLAYDPPLGLDKLPAHLKKDPVHRWRAETGVELAHKEPDFLELSRIYANWHLMTPEQKAQSDLKAKGLFGKSNEELFQSLPGEYTINPAELAKKWNRNYKTAANALGTLARAWYSLKAK